MEQLQTKFINDLKITEKTANMYIYYLNCANKKQVYNNIKFLYEPLIIYENIFTYTLSTKNIIVGTIIRILKYVYQNSSENLRKKYKTLIEAYSEKIRTFKKDKQPVQTVPQDILECLKVIIDTIEIMLNMLKTINNENNAIIKEKRELPASLKEALKTNQYIAKELDTNICPSILKFVSI